MTHILKHEHLIVQATVNKPLQDPTVATQWMEQLIKKINMELMLGPYAAYCTDDGNQGLTIAAIIKTSHIVMHIWDAVSPALCQLDIYSCSTLDLDKVWEHFQVMDPVELNWKFLDRENGLKVLDQSM